MKQVIISSATAASLLQFFFTAFVAGTFMQSGFDKVMDYPGNRKYLEDQFRNSILSRYLPVLFPLIVIEEVATGLLGLIGAVMIIWDNDSVALLALVMAAFVFLQLFLGQRLAKDYAGAAGLVPYFLTAMVGIFVFILIHS